MEVLLVGAFLGSLWAYRSKLIAAYADESLKSQRRQEFTIEGGNEHLHQLSKLNDPVNRGYRRPALLMDVLPLENVDTTVLTPTGRQLLRDPEFKAGYIANYVNAVDRVHPLLQFTRRKYLYGGTRPFIYMIGSTEDMARGGQPPL